MNVSAYARSNWFKIKQELVDEFRRWAEARSLLVLGIDDGQGYALLSDGEGWPVEAYTDPESDELLPVDVPSELSRFLQPGSVAVLMEVSHMWPRSLRGLAVAVNSEGNTVGLNLMDIYERAKLLGDHIQVT